MAETTTEASGAGGIAPEAAATPMTLAGALQIGIAMVAGMFIVVRPSNQFTPYSGESAFCGVLAVTFAFVVACSAFFHIERVRFSRGLTVVLSLWLAIFAFGLWRSQNLGVGVPMAGDAGLYALMLMIGIIIARLEPLLVGVITRGFIGMMAVEAFAGVWQRYVDLPRMRVEVANGNVSLPTELQSGLGLARMGGNQVYSTFANPNSLAGYLLVGIFLLLGLLWRRNRVESMANAPAGSRNENAATLYGGFALLLLLAGLTFTGSKGGMAAAGAGLWFFAAQGLATRYPQHRRTLIAVTAGGVATAVLLLTLGCAGLLGWRPFGWSMEVRFDYWRSAAVMIRDHWLGIGLGGFGDYYTFYKLPMGEEVKDTHNDFLQLATELSVLSVLIYGAIWWFVLRPAKPASASSTQPSIEHEFDDAERLKLLDLCIVAGGVVAFFLMDFAFSWFDSGDVFALFAKTPGAAAGHTLDRGMVLGALHTLFLPVLFGATVIGLRPLLQRGQYSLSWTWGCRAAIGAVLIHELVDFDFRSPATMSAIFLCGGMLAGAYSKRIFDPGESRLSAKRPAFALLGLTLLLAMPLVTIPMRAAGPRYNAESMESDIQDFAKKAGQNSASPEAQMIPQVRLDILEERKKARDAAPFDAETWIDLGLAYDLLPLSENATANRRAAQDCFETAEKLRPQSAVPKMMLGQFYIRHAFIELSVHDAGAGGDFAKARAAFAAAAERYPLHPGMRLHEGDAALLDDPAGAGDAYWKAFDIDMRIDDSSTRLTAIFVDPRPGAFARHGFDNVVLRGVDVNLSRGQAVDPPKMAPDKLMDQQRFGLLLRRMVALAWILHQHELMPSLNTAELKSTRAELLGTCTKLAASAPDLPARAHASLLLALSTRMLDEDTQKSIAGKLWDDAVALQNESVKASHPGTPEYTFGIIVKYYRK